MAKGSQLGLQKGKLGNTVKYRISGSNNKEEQGTRAYQPVVANPKTMAQAAQRVKMTPAVNFYRAFQEEILDHSFQGEKYGARCHAAFMKAALKMNVGFPFVPMGREAVAPGEYLMSRGSIPSMVYDWDDTGKLVCAALAVEDGLDEFGVWSQDVLSAAPWLQNGDQITIAFVLGNEDGNEFPFVCRLVLDTENTTDQIGNVLDNLKIQFSGEGVVALNGIFGYDIEGAVIIVSRPTISQTTGAVSWLRSTEHMKPNFMLGYMRQRFFSQDAYDAAMYTYMAASKNNITSDWYLNQGKAAAQSQKIPVAPLPDMPISINATYKPSWTEHPERLPWGMEPITLPEGGSEDTLEILLSSDDDLDVNLVAIRNADTQSSVQLSKSKQSDGSIRAILTLGSVATGTWIEAVYDSKKITGRMQVSYSENP